MVSPSWCHLCAAPVRGVGRDALPPLLQPSLQTVLQERCHLLTLSKHLKLPGQLCARAARLLMRSAWSGGFCFTGDGVQTSQGLCDVFSLCSLWQKGEHKKGTKIRAGVVLLLRSLLQIGTCKLVRRGVQRTSHPPPQHRAAPPHVEQHRRTSPSGGSAPGLPSTTAGVSNGPSRCLLKQLQGCFRWWDQGSGCTVGCPDVPYRHRHRIMES